MIMNDELRDLIMAQRLDRRAARRWPADTAWCRCATPAWKVCFDGITTIEEVIRETVLEA